jgi:hypothetical protein
VLLTIVHIPKGCKFKLNNYFCRYEIESSGEIEVYLESEDLKILGFVDLKV